MAAKFDEPVALSVSELSDSGVIKLSVSVKPILASAVESLPDLGRLVPVSSET